MVVNLQVLFTTHRTRALVRPDQKPARIHHQTSRRSSYLAVHSGSKAYLHGFSRALAIELYLVREPPLDIECLAVDVYNVATNSNSSAVGFFVRTRETMGKAIVAVVGRSVTPYWRAEFVSYVLACAVVSGWTISWRG